MKQREFKTMMEARDVFGLNSVQLKACSAPQLVIIAQALQARIREHNKDYTRETAKLVADHESEIDMLAGIISRRS